MTCCTGTVVVAVAAAVDVAVQASAGVVLGVVVVVVRSSRLRCKLRAFRTKYRVLRKDEKFDNFLS